ncbi:FtsK/SpoIIIE domain-containing protein [Micromonospora soli]|uniref:FtsK/SpoIIIE domain-containing protein n=1 Tax=Micromonospora sp. NBRC 110009 TaxID=3061627 RepID=UPI002672C848|nr:FtsK/SpoIIIE domain-containing protein [Micromonospora sp. NBRC 110009]WKU01272.1 FtsK/SpoIIIE domain-containing protein [Micromonospora sp. NBRC 110009]
MDAVASPKARAGRAAVLHRRAEAAASAAAGILDEIRPAPADHHRQYELAERLRASAALAAPGWAGDPLEGLTVATPPGDGPPPVVRVGTAAPLDDARFPALVPLLGSGHLTVDADAGDPRVAGLLRALLLRLFAATPAGALLVRAVDGTGPADTFAGFAALADAGLLPPPATDAAGLRAVLAEAEQWVAAGTARQRGHDRTLLLMLATLPDGTAPSDRARIEGLAAQGHRAGLHLVVAGWPAAAPLPQATSIAVRTAYALVGDPPGAALSGPGAESPGGLNSPVFLAEDPPVKLVAGVCRRLARQIEDGTRLSLSDLLPAGERWQSSSTDALSTMVGDAAGRPVSLGFTELTPHWLVSGRSAAGRSAFLTNVLFGLTARYAPDELVLHLADLGDGDSFVEFLQTERDRSWVPQVRTAGMAADREYVADLLEELAAELRRREDAGRRAGGQRYAELREHQSLPRIVCVIDNFPLLLRERDRLATDLLARLDALARAARAYGIHLVLAGEGDLGIGGPRDPLLGQFPVRVALPGGSAVLEPTNDAAAGLPVGSAVVNTAGGLGGPRGATRGHERMIRFPDPHEDPDALADLRHRLWSARPEGGLPPVVFAGYARPLLTNDPRYRAALAGRAPAPAALLGRAVDVHRSTAAVPLGPAAGRNLAVLGRDEEAERLLVTAVRSAAVQPGRVRFVLAPLANGSAGPAAALAEELAERHEVETVDVAGLRAAMEEDAPGYLVVFGLDVPDADELPPELLRSLLLEGPPGGRHLLGWWRSVAPLTGLLGPEGEVDKLTAVVVTDVPGGRLEQLFDRPVSWRPRPGRAVLWDGPGEQGTVLVPFGEEPA